LAIEGDAKRFDEMVEGCRWRIENDAENHQPLGGSPMRMCRAQSAPGEPIVRVLFTITDDEFCDLWWVDLADDPESPDDPIEG
jgi:hypothetical protein